MTIEHAITSAGVGIIGYGFYELMLSLNNKFQLILSFIGG